jgi:hypothetical protein
MAGLIAACGTDCEACDAYIATQTNDQERARRTAERWAKQLGGTVPVPIAATVCDGCLTSSPRKGGYCADCPLRACATQKNVETCAHCPEYACATLEAFVAKAPMMRERLAQIHEDYLRSRA